MAPKTSKSKRSSDKEVLPGYSEKRERNNSVSCINFNCFETFYEVS